MICFVNKCNGNGIYDRNKLFILFLFIMIVSIQLGEVIKYIHLKDSGILKIMIKSINWNRGCKLTSMWIFSKGLRFVSLFE